MKITTSQCAAASFYLYFFVLQSNVHYKGLCMTTERPFRPVSVLTVSVETEKCSVGGLILKKLVLALVVLKRSSSLFRANAASSVLVLITVLKVTTVTPMPPVLTSRRPTLVTAMMASLEWMVDHVQVRLYSYMMSYCSHYLIQIMEMLCKQVFRVLSAVLKILG